MTGLVPFADWRSRTGLPSRPWLLLGKGPSFEARAQYDLSAFNTMSLNHVVAEQRVDVAHVLDFEVAEQCASAVRDNAGVLLMPRHPNISFARTRLPLDELIVHSPALAALAADGRVVVYERAPAAAPGPHIRVQYFSAEAALDLLGHLGARTVRTLGIDGGSAYAATFEHVSPHTRLANGQTSFSVQSRMLRETAERHRMEVHPLVETMRVFVGVDESQLLAAAVLEHSIREHTAGPVEVTPMLKVESPMPRDERNRPRTAFSFSRFHIPALAGFHGRALYLDADMQVFSDLRELWEIPFDGAKVLCTNQPEPPEQWRGSPYFHPGRQMSVMMLDCAALDWDVAQIVRGLDEGRYTYEQLMFDMCLLERDEIRDGLPPEWNHLEHYERGSTKLLHYTVVPTQPWKNDKNPLRHLWEEAFARAWAEGVVPPSLLREQILRRHVKRRLKKLAPERPVPALAPPASALEAELREVRSRLDDAERGPVARLTGAVTRRISKYV